MKMKVFTVRIPVKFMRELRKQYAPPRSVLEGMNVSDNKLINSAVFTATQAWQKQNLTAK
jgi:hypothetical protein